MTNQKLISLGSTCLVLASSYACNTRTKKVPVAAAPQEQPSLAPGAPTPPSGVIPSAPQSPVPQLSPPPQPTELKVEIQNKEALHSVKVGEELTVQFNMPAATQNPKISTLCRVGRSEDFALLPPKACSGPSSHNIGKMDANVTYIFSVELRDQTSNAKLAEDMVNIHAAEGSLDLVVEGAEQLRGQSTGNITINVRANQQQANLGLLCTLDAANTAVPCVDGRINLSLDQYPGQHTLNVKAMGPNNTVLVTKSLPFCGGISCAAATQPAVAVINQMGLGAGYSVNLPPTMHVLQYSSNRSFNASATNVLQVIDDPFYNPPRCGNIGIATGTDTFNPGRIVHLADGMGQVYSYCSVAVPLPPAAVTSNGQGPNLAYNSIEFSTSADTVAKSQYERFFFNSYEDNAQAVFLKSRFWALCSHNFTGGVASMKVVLNWYRQVDASQAVNYCQTQITGSLGEVIEVMVAGFFFTKPNSIYPSTLEAVYIVQPGVINFSLNTANFHRLVVGRMRSIIDSTGLNEPFAGYIP